MRGARDYTVRLGEAGPEHGTDVVHLEIGRGPYRVRQIGQSFVRTGSMTDVEGKATVARKTKPQRRYMLHDPTTMEGIGAYKGQDYRTAALKACSKNQHKNLEFLILRETKTKKCTKYTHRVVQLAEPKVVKKAGKEIVYTKMPIVEAVDTFIYDLADLEADQ